MNSDLYLSYPVNALLEEARASLESIADDFKDIFLLIDSKGRILKVNSFAASLFRVSPESMVNTNVSKIFSDESLEIFNQNMQRLTSLFKESELDSMEHHVEFELNLDCLAERILAVFWTIRLIPLRSFNQEILFSIVGRDISVSVQIESKQKQLEFQNNRIQAILDSALQGFLTYDSSLKIEKDYSKKAEELLGGDLVGKNVCDVLNLNHSSFGEFSEVVFLGTNWELLKNFSKLESEVNERILRTELVPIIEDGIVKRILAAVTDVTEVVQLQKRAERTTQVNRTIVKILQSKKLFSDVIRSVRKVQSSLFSLIDAKRVIHTWKGEFSFFECQDFVDVCHEWEGKIKGQFYVDQFELFLKKLVTSIDHFLDNYDHILMIRASNEGEILVNFVFIKNLVRTALSLNSPKELLDPLEGMLEAPFQESLSWLNEVWLTAGEKLGKVVSPIQWGESVRIFVEPYKRLFGSLVHAVRNAADHGIEYSQERVAQGKSKAGILKLQLELKGGIYQLKMRDDGRGLNLEKIREIAQKRGIEEPDSVDVSGLVFEEDFSTADAITEYSGRGIGLNAVRAEARLLGGDAHVKNEPNAGLELIVFFKKKSLSEIFYS